MQIIISPAKKMKIDSDSFEILSQPKFVDKTYKILQKLKSMSGDELQQMWKCSGEIAKENFIRLENMDLHKNLTPAILAYQGIQYQYMGANVFSFAELDYIKNNLNILSGFYGCLKAFDGVVPYRLEMQAKVEIDNHKNLYSFWGDSLASSINDDTIINLASKEYSKAIKPYVKDKNFITCSFTQKKGDKLVEKATMCKMARGSMIRFLAENNIENPKDIKEFDLLNFRFSKENSTNKEYVFIKGED